MTHQNQYTLPQVLNFSALSIHSHLGTVLGKQSSEQLLTKKKKRQGGCLLNNSVRKLLWQIIHIPFWLTIIFFPANGIYQLNPSLNSGIFTWQNIGIPGEIFAKLSPSHWMRIRSKNFFPMSSLGSLELWKECTPFPYEDLVNASCPH